MLIEQQSDMPKKETLKNQFSKVTKQTEPKVNCKGKGGFDFQNCHLTLFYMLFFFKKTIKHEKKQQNMAHT